MVGNNNKNTFAARKKILVYFKILNVNTLSYKTKSQKKEEVQRNWLIVDADGEVVGRLAAKVAHVLRGKHKTDYTPHVDTGDFVIIINAEKVRFTGNKLVNKTYTRYTGYPGGLKLRTAKEMLQKKPFGVMENAIKGMLPKNKLGRMMFRKLFVYAGPDHPHQAQKPQDFKF